MTKRDKVIEQLLTNPANLRFQQIEQILHWYEFEKIPAKGSHLKFKHPYFKSDLIIPVHKGDCKEFYKKEVQRRIKQLM